MPCELGCHVAVLGNKLAAAEVVVVHLLHPAKGSGTVTSEEGVLNPGQMWKILINDFLLLLTWSASYEGSCWRGGQGGLRIERSQLQLWTEGGPGQKLLPIKRF